MQERVINMDITNFMTWFLEQVVDMFTAIFIILDSIEFAGTSLLRVILTILVLGSLLSVILTISKSVNYVGGKSERVRSRRSDRRSDNEKD